MNGPTELMLDTSAVIDLLHGDGRVIAIVGEAKLFVISIVTCLELLSFPSMKADDTDVLRAFFARSRIIDLRQEDSALLDQIAGVRRASRLKLPDAIIAGSAIARNLALVTSDRHLLSSVPNLKTIGY